jgi:hypothetical protein
MPWASNNVVPHPHRDLMAEAEHERKVADSREAQALQQKIYKAVDAYWQFLEDRGVLWEDDRLKASALVVTLDHSGIETRVQMVPWTSPRAWSARHPSRDATG